MCELEKDWNDTSGAKVLVARLHSRPGLREAERRREKQPEESERAKIFYYKMHLNFCPWTITWPLKSSLLAVIPSRKIEANMKIAVAKATLCAKEWIHTHPYYSGRRSKIPNDIILLSFYEYFCQRRPILRATETMRNGWMYYIYMCLHNLYKQKLWSTTMRLWTFRSYSSIQSLRFNANFCQSIFFTLLRCVPSLASPGIQQTNKKEEKK